MSKATADQLEIFYELSSALTDFDKIDLVGTGVGEEYFGELVRNAGEAHVNKLLAEAKKAGTSPESIRKKIWDDKQLGPLARNLVLMWYLGSWYPLSEEWSKEHRPDLERVSEHVVSAVAYKEALWAPAIGAHPRGDKPPGFGSWEKPAVMGGHDDKWVSENRKPAPKRKTSK
jgi:hypothetical protein